MSIEKCVITNKGRALLAKTHGGAGIQVTRWQIGSGVLPSSKAEEDMTALVNPVKELPIASLERSEARCTITGQFVNTGMAAFAFEELGLWAVDPDEGEILYAVGEARGSGDRIEAGTVKLREFVFGMDLLFDSTDQVTAVIDAGLIFASKEELAEVAAMDGYLRRNGMAAWMGRSGPGGPLMLDNIQGNTVLGGAPAYNAPVSMESVEGPLKLHVAAKNLVRPVWNLDTQTQNGVTCTRNGDVFVLSGTNSGGGSINFYINRYDTESAFSLPAGTYTMSGMPNREDSSSFVLSLYRRLPGGTNEQLANDYGNPSRSKQTFTIDTALDNLFLVIAIGAGVNVDGVTITPQIEVGNEATGYEAPSNTTVEIPLLGTDGQALEPLRMSYIGRYGTGALPVPDRIIRKDGVWCVERNTAVADLTTATWGISTNYLTPYLNSNAIRGQESHWVLCTHFPSSGANPSTVWTAGIWMGSGLAINKESLPSGTSTTQEEMAAWCAAQAEAGTPVLVCYVRTEPVYEELHQDVQVLLNTLAVPGGVCSVWFEGDIPPSNADIGMPRGDYPNAGVEGAYRWLEELSNPLPPPTTADLYAWALSQQRGGVFATSGAVTTQNVPEAGDLTGILFVTEQGSAVSMIVFGPTGKIHTAARIAGVWRGWSLMYSALALPPAMSGATSGAAGAAGLVPAPAAGTQDKYLRGDGTWATVPADRPARFVVGTSAAGWTADDCDYLCDGTSDQAEINAAIAALPSGGGEVLLLDGTYNISSSITVNKANVSLRGCGAATVLTRKFNGTSANGVISCSAANCTISHLAIDGDKGSYTNENNRGVYATTSAANFTIEDLSIQNSRDGIYVGGMTGGCITGCRIKNSGAYGVYVYNAAAIDISHNHIDAAGETAVLITGGKSVNVNGNTITGSGNYGARLIGSATMCTIVNNICLDNAGGISLEAVSMCNVSGNLCMRGSGTPEDYDSVKVTIRTTAGASNNIISGNLVMGKNIEDSGTGNLVTNNKFE